MSNKSFDPIIGYGLADASAGVAKAINQETFPSVPDFGGVNDWNLNMVNAPEVWAQGYTGSGIVVAVLDSGVDRNQTDLNSNIWRNNDEIPDNGIDDDNNGFVDDVFGWNFVNNNNDTLDVYGHGTHVSGTIAGNNDGNGVTGVAYDAQIMPVKVLSNIGIGSVSSVNNGIVYAVDNGANVINLSLSSSSPSITMLEAINYATANGVVVFMAAGNEGAPEPDFPARFAKQVGVSVGAVDSNNNIAYFSNLAGDDPALINVTSPGVRIYSSLPNNQYARWNGTSMATPHSAGIAALMLQANPNLTDAEIRDLITSTSNDNPDTPPIDDTDDSEDAPETIVDDSPEEPDDSQGPLNTPIYRFQNSDVSGTYLFVGEEEGENILTNFPNFIFEGQAFKVGIEPGDDLIAMNRFQNSNLPGTYLYAGQEESKSIRQNFPNFIEEGVAFYVYNAGSGNGQPFYRFQNSNLPGTYIFVAEEERQSILTNFPNFVEEGVAFKADI